MASDAAELLPRTTSYSTAVGAAPDIRQAPASAPGRDGPGHGSRMAGGRAAVPLSVLSTGKLESGRGKEGKEMPGWVFETCPRDRSSLWGKVSYG